jgi:hypothetical protein
LGGRQSRHVQTKSEDGVSGHALDGIEDRPGCFRRSESRSQCGLQYEKRCDNRYDPNAECRKQVWFSRPLQSIHSEQQRCEGNSDGIMSKPPHPQLTFYGRGFRYAFMSPLTAEEMTDPAAEESEVERWDSKLPHQ